MRRWWQKRKRVREWRMRFRQDRAAARLYDMVTGDWRSAIALAHDDHIEIRPIGPKPMTVQEIEIKTVVDFGAHELPAVVTVHLRAAEHLAPGDVLIVDQFE